MSELPNNRRKDPVFATNQVLIAAAILAVSGLIVVPWWLGAVLGTKFTPGASPVPLNPAAVILGTVKGEIVWPGLPAWIVIGVYFALLLLVFLMWQGLRKRKRKNRTRVDRLARYAGRGADIQAITASNAKATAARLGVDGATYPGVPIGICLHTGQTLYGSWEDMHVDIWGPRTGKTTSRAIPAICEAPGAVVVTSNKRDVVDSTRDVRGKHGQVWVFDPQSIANEPATWWWNPLSYVTNEVKAKRLADHFASGSRDPGARTDAFFDPAAQDLLAGLFLAAAITSQPITKVYYWLTRPTDDEPAVLLRENGYPMISDQVAAHVYSPDKQRAGVYGVAQQMAACLTNRNILPWVTNEGLPRPEFDPTQFVRGRHSLYSLSKEGQGTAGPLVTALTVAVVEAAEELATCSAGGRLPVPMVGVLDEAANVCRWRDLPALYSHYGSRGIVLMTILQSWSQGCDVWGEAGMRKLWSASNIKVYGGGVDEAAFLEDLSRVFGDYDRLSQSSSVSSGSTSRSSQLVRERILDVAELAALPRGRAVVFSSGSRPTIVKTRPWFTTDYAAAVKSSIANHDPGTTK